jgi:hypothetical protein
MVLAFFNTKGLTCTNVLPRGSMEDAIYNMKALGKFMKICRKKRPKTVVG